MFGNGTMLAIELMLIKPNLSFSEFDELLNCAAKAFRAYFVNKEMALRLRRNSV
jgi:hypothetical protein